MKYADLIQPAEPLETVKQIRESGTFEAAKRDVETFVISDRMAGQLTDVIFPNLRYDQPGDQKGILTVATYGTGKTHLMSVVAGVAEYGDLVEALTHPDVAAAAKTIAGRFKVIRFDIGATRLPLRDIVCTELQRGLAAMGVNFSFPDWDTVTNTKDALTDMMTAFEVVHPDHGLLFVLDEMLEYLRARRDTELIQDLIFLRGSARSVGLPGSGSYPASRRPFSTIPASPGWPTRSAVSAIASSRSASPARTSPLSSSSGCSARTPPSEPESLSTSSSSHRCTTVWLSGWTDSSHYSQYILTICVRSSR
jgi:hypothetical protein